MKSIINETKSITKEHIWSEVKKDIVFIYPFESNVFVA